MLDTYVVKSGPSRVDVHEHRAPTADSVRLLRDMEADTQKRVLAGFRPDGDIPVSAVVFKRPDAGGWHASDVAIIQVRIAGRVHTIEVAIETVSALADPPAIARLVYDAVLRRLAETITLDVLPSLVRTR